MLNLNRKANKEEAIVVKIYEMQESQQPLETLYPLKEQKKPGLLDVHYNTVLSLTKTQTQTVCSGIIKDLEVLTSLENWNLALDTIRLLQIVSDKHVTPDMIANALGEYFRVIAQLDLSEITCSCLYIAEIVVQKGLKASVLWNMSFTSFASPEGYHSEVSDPAFQKLLNGYIKLFDRLLEAKEPTLNYTNVLSVMMDLLGIFVLEKPKLVEQSIPYMHQGINELMTRFKEKEWIQYFFTAFTAWHTMETILDWLPGCRKLFSRLFLEVVSNGIAQVCLAESDDFQQLQQFLPNLDNVKIKPVLQEYGLWNDWKITQGYKFGSDAILFVNYCISVITGTLPDLNRQQRLYRLFQLFVQNRSVDESGRQKLILIFLLMVNASLENSDKIAGDLFLIAFHGQDKAQWLMETLLQDNLGTCAWVVGSKITPDASRDIPRLLKVYEQKSTQQATIRVLGLLAYWVTDSKYYWQSGRDDYLKIVGSKDKLYHWMVFLRFVSMLDPEPAARLMFGHEASIQAIFQQPLTLDHFHFIFFLLETCCTMSPDTLETLHLVLLFQSLLKWIQASIKKENFSGLCLLCTRFFDSSQRHRSVVNACFSSGFIGGLVALLSHETQHIVKVLQAAIMHDRGLLKQFVDHEGYKALLECEPRLGWTKTLELYESMLYMSQSNSIPLIVHPKAVSTLFDFYPRLPKEKKQWVLAKLYSLGLPSNYQALYQMCRSKLPGKLIKLLLESNDEPFEELVDLLVLLLGFNTDFADLKLLITGLKLHTETNKLQRYHDLCLQVLRNVAYKIPEINEWDYFVSMGNEWSFEAPKLMNWPENSSRGYSFFFSFKGNWNAFDSQSDSFVVCALDFQKFRIYFLIRQSKLVLECHQQDTVVQAVSELQMNAQDWYSVCFTHEVGLFNAHTAKILIDGQQTWKGPLPFPPVGQPAQLLVSSVLHHELEHTHCFPGYFSSFALFDTALPVEQIQTIDISKEVSLPISSTLYHFQLLTPTQQPVLYYHPLGMSSADECFNISVHESHSLLGPLKLRGIAAVTNTSLSGTLETLGGLNVLYPILGQIGFEIEDGLPTVDPRERICSSLQLLVALIRTSSSHRNHFIESKGPMLISLQLQRLPPEYLSMQSFEAALELRSIRHATSNLVAMVDQSILFEPQIWSLGDKSLQEQYFARVHELSEKFPEISASFGFQYWIDSIEQFFANHDTGAQFAWNYLESILIKSGLENVGRLIESLICSIHSPVSIPLYKIFARLGTQNFALFQRVFEIKGSGLIIRLLQSIHCDIRNCALEMMEFVFQSPKMQRMKQQIIETPGSVWTHLLRPYSYTFTTYYALLTLVFEKKMEPQPLAETNLKIKNTTFVKVLVDLLGTASDVDLEVESRLHEDFLFLTQTPENIPLLRQSSSVYIVAEYLRRQTSLHPEDSITNHTKNSVYLLTGLVLQGPIKDQFHSQVLVEIITSLYLLLSEQVALQISHEFMRQILERMKPVLAEKLTDEDERHVIQVLQDLEHFFFNYQQISLAISRQYQDNLHNFSSLLKTVHESVKTDLQLTYQTTFPFEDNPQLSFLFLDVLESIISLKEPPRNVFPFLQDKKNHDILVMIACRMIVSGLSTYNEQVWMRSLTLMDVLLQRNLPKSGLSKDFFFFVMGNLVDAWKRGPIPLLYRCIAEAFKIWGQTFKTATSQFRNVDFITLTLTFEGTEAFIQSDLWVSFYDLHLHPAMRSIENESISQLEPIVLKYLNTAKQWLTKVHKDVEHTFNQCQTIVQQIDKATELESESRKKRLSERITAYEMSNQEVARLWNVQSQQVYFERQVWESEDTPKYYHLDPHENRLRMRRRLVRNYQFDDHHLASEKRDKVPETHRRRNSAPHAAVHALPDRKEILLERLRKLHAVTKEPSLLEFEEELPEEEPNYSSQLERCLKSVEACMIVYMTTIKGRFEVTTTHLRFFPEMLSYSRPSAPNISSPTLNTMMGSGTRVNEYKWPISMLERVFLRRYKLNPCAIEFFFTNGTAFLFTVEEENPQLERIRLVKKIMSLKPPNLLPVHFGTPLESLAATDLTQKWVNREISNFEYLMWLNTFSGRSYNDLTRYPVFPWIIANYDSQELDLNDPSVFRDLSKPMGALNETRLKYFKERAEAFEDPSGQVQKFLYGSHYSSSGGVLFYLLRLEPFTSLHIALQGGKFDHPDRQFQSFEQLWYSVTTSTSDVKELIPEFFYLPDFLRNHNHFDLGITQAGHKLDDVGLPKWAKTPEEFIRVHRRALESEYVSENLHHWVDLIWGYKQTGPQAEEANNLFYYLTYEGVVNLKDIKDPVERRSIEEQINHFGQTPSRLFLKPHPQRQSKPKASFDTLLLQKSVFQLEAKLEHPRFFFISNLCLESKRMEPRIVLMDALLEIHHYKLKETVPKIYKRQWSRRLSPDLKSRQLIAMTGDGRHVFLGGHFDLSFRHYSLVGNAVKFMDRVYEHMAKVSCLGLSEDERWLCSGSLDCTVRVWELKYTKDKCIVQRGPEKVIYGHNAQISCLLVNADHGIVVSGSQDGTVMISGLYSNISPASISLGPQISKIMLHPVDAHLYILQKDNLHIYTLNGIHVKTMSFEGIKDFDIHQSGNVLAIGLPHAVVFTHGSDLERYQHQTSLESPNLERIQFLDNQMVVFSDLQIQLITL